MREPLAAGGQGGGAIAATESNAPIGGNRIIGIISKEHFPPETQKAEIVTGLQTHCRPGDLTQPRQVVEQTSHARRDPKHPGPARQMIEIPLSAAEDSAVGFPAPQHGNRLLERLLLGLRARSPGEAEECPQAVVTVPRVCLAAEHVECGIDHRVGKRTQPALYERLDGNRTTQHIPQVGKTRYEHERLRGDDT